MDATADYIRDGLGRLQGLPAPVADWRVRTGEDWVGDPAVWVWPVLANEDTDFDTCALMREQVRDEVSRLTRARTGQPLWAFVRFLWPSDIEDGA